MFWAGAQVDNAQMLPSPFDNVHGGANAVAHIPSSMQQSSTEGDKLAGGPFSCLTQPASMVQPRSLHNTTLSSCCAISTVHSCRHLRFCPQSWC